MKPYHGVYKIPCKVNGISLDFIFDTGASKVSLSSTEAMFMYKNGIIKSSDFGEAVTFSVADGKSLVGMNLTLRSVKIGRKILYDVPATVVNSENAPLLLGQSVLSELGVIQFDYNDNTLTFYNDESSIPDIGNFYEMREQKMNDYEVVLRKNKKELETRRTKNGLGFEFYYSGGGVVPDTLKGFFTDIFTANTARDLYLSTRYERPVKKEEAKPVVERKYSGKPVKVK